jgi:predicted nuclease with TOPRIM domain
MARKKSAATIEAEIAKVKSDMEKLQGRYDTLAEKLKELEAQKRRAESEAIMDAYVKSGRSLDEVLTFFTAMKVLVQLF